MISAFHQIFSTAMNFFRLCGTQKLSVPAVYIQSGKTFSELINADEINRIDSTDALIGLVTQRLKQFLA